jgi:hypothetical protein
MKIILLAVILFATGIVANAQNTPPDLRNFKEIARTEKFMYMLDTKNIKWAKDEATLDILQAHYKLYPDKSWALNSVAYVVTTFKANCETKSVLKLKEVGVWPVEIAPDVFAAKPLNTTFKTPEEQKPHAGQVVLVLDSVCTATDIQITNTDG